MTITINILAIITMEYYNLSDCFTIIIMLWKRVCLIGHNVITFS